MRQEKRVGNMFPPQKNDQLILGRVEKCAIMLLFVESHGEALKHEPARSRLCSEKGRKDC